MKEYAPRCRLDSSEAWVIIFSTEVNYLRENIYRRQEIDGKILLPNAIHVTIV